MSMDVHLILRFEQVQNFQADGSLDRLKTMETAFEQFWSLVWGVLTLNPEVYNQIHTLPQGNIIALSIVIAAGLSEAIGQCVVLFINRVKPLRFFLSLGIAAVLFAFSYLFWATSVWLVSHFFYGTQLTELQLITVLRTLGLNYAPLLFGFLMGLPYFGIPIFVLLSLWILLAEIVGWQAITNLGTWEVFVCVGLGWVVFQILQRTVGRPIVILGQWIQNKVAGTQLVKDQAGIEQIILAGNPMSLRDVSNEVIQTSTEVISSASQRRFTPLKLILIGLAAFAIILFFSSDSQDALSTWYLTLGKTLRLIINLIGISLIALFFSIVLTPFEALGWWAGWYGSEPLKYFGTSIDKTSPSTSIDRYVIYLDGINQGSYEYLPNVERLLNHLATTLPKNILIVKGIMPYTVTNQPLSENHPLAFLWRMLESFAVKRPTNPIGLIINIRNMVAVAVSADPRYGPIQNQGLAQVLFNSLVNFGYPVGSKTPITLIGYSGGGQMSMGAVSFLKQTLDAPIEVISLAGVISGNTEVMKVEHLYHLVGEKDNVEKLGSIMFPGRWPILFLSNWNRAKRRGKISLISLGPVAHNGPDGLMAAEVLLRDGRSHLQQTVEIITGILLKKGETTGLDPKELITLSSNYKRYKAAPFNQLNYYPVNQSINLEYYQPIGTWIGRLILPPAEQRQTVKGVWLEIYHADSDHQHRIGQIVNLRWSNQTRVQTYVKLVTQDVNFIYQAYQSQRQGKIHPERINGWQQVDPLESLAGALPNDEMIVKLPDPVIVEDTESERLTLYIHRDPIQITGRFYGLVKIVKSLGNDLFKVRHYSRQSQQFDGLEEIVYIPTVIPRRNGVFPSTNHQLEKSPVNSSGWYIYGAKNSEGKFVVESLAPRSLLSLKPEHIIQGKKATINFMNFHAWDKTVDNKGHAYSILLDPQIEEYPNEKASDWQEGERALLMHVYGGIGGKKPEPSPGGIFFGHFSFGVANVIRDPLSDELRFDIEYRQIYTHNSDGIVSGTLAWMRYMGARQWGWLGCRPTCDVLVKFSPLTKDYDFDGLTFSPLTYVINELDIMAARYRIGDGTGTTFVSAVNSCVQDSSQAFYSALRRMMAEMELNPLIIKWLKDHPQHEQTQRFILLVDLVKNLERYLTPLKKVRSDWRYNMSTLGSFPLETPGKTLLKVIASWRTLLPRWTCDQVSMIFLQLGASLWLLRTNQVGGNNPSIEPIAPTDFSIAVPKVKQSKRLHKAIN